MSVIQESLGRLVVNLGDWKSFLLKREMLLLQVNQYLILLQVNQYLNPDEICNAIAACP